MFSAMAAGGDGQKRCACIFWWSCRSTLEVRVGGVTGKPVALRAFLELARNTVARTNEEAGNSGPTFEVSE